MVFGEKNPQELVKYSKFRLYPTENACTIIFFVSNMHTNR